MPKSRLRKYRKPTQQSKKSIDNEFKSIRPTRTIVLVGYKPEEYNKNVFQDYLYNLGSLKTLLNASYAHKVITRFSYHGKNYISDFNVVFKNSITGFDEMKTSLTNNFPVFFRYIAMERCENITMEECLNPSGILVIDMPEKAFLDSIKSYIESLG